MNSGSSPASWPIQTLAVVGLGLIGGSVALAARARRLALRLVGVGRDPRRLAGAVARGIVDDASTDLRGVAASADLIVFCTPVDTIVEAVRLAAAAARPRTLLTDAGSVKEAICGPLGTGWPNGVAFVGAHPLAGSEKQGYEHADPRLFEDRVCVLTPDPATPRGAVERVAAFWQSLGACVVEMTAAEHDVALAQTSHVPHVVASALAATLAPRNYGLAATGFRDTTRIAEGDPELWSAILLANARHVLEGLDRCDQHLAGFREALRLRDQPRLQELLARGRQNRIAWSRSQNEAAH